MAKNSLRDLAVTHHVAGIYETLAAKVTIQTISR